MTGMAHSVGSRGTCMCVGEWREELKERRETGVGRNAWVPCLLNAPPYQPPRDTSSLLLLNLWVFLSVFCSSLLPSQVTDGDTRGLCGIYRWQSTAIKNMGWGFKQAWVQTLSLLCDLR